MRKTLSIQTMKKRNYTHEEDAGIMGEIRGDT
jgi:hypothetical protein